MRGCNFQDKCAESESDISTGIFERYKLKEFLATEGVDIKLMSAAEEGGLVAVLLVLLIILFSMLKKYADRAKILIAYVSKKWEAQ